MSTDQVQIERRAAQRFDFHRSVSVRLAGRDRDGCGFTQNLCTRGALFHTDLPLCEADAIELTLIMPSEITLAENMRVRCRGRVLRVLSSAVGGRSVVAVHLDGYEFLPETDDRFSECAQDFKRVGALHEHLQEKEKASTAVPKASLRASQP
jgi:hypothetical protein